MMRTNFAAHAVSTPVDGARAAASTRCLSSTLAITARSRPRRLAAPRTPAGLLRSRPCAATYKKSPLATITPCVLDLCNAGNPRDVTPEACRAPARHDLRRFCRAHEDVEVAAREPHGRGHGSPRRPGHPPGQPSGRTYLRARHRSRARIRWGELSVAKRRVDARRGHRCRCPRFFWPR